MNTTAAAAEAGVSIPTIRVWARRGVIAAAKVAGRWVIDTASLAHRIAIAAMRTRKATVTETPAKPEFVPFTRAEFNRTLGGDPEVRIVHYADKDSFGTDVFRYQFPDAVVFAGKFWRGWNDAAKAACETALAAAGWTVTSEWTQRRAKTFAAVTAS